MIEINRQGGINDTSSEAIRRAKTVDLITLPLDVKGTNCYNCRFVHIYNAQQGFCKHPQIRQAVNSRMCCALWDRIGSNRPWKDKE